MAETHAVLKAKAMMSDLLVIDFVNFLAKLSLSQPITSGGGPSILQVRKYCTRLYRGGYGIEAARWDDVGIIEVPRRRR